MVQFVLNNTYTLIDKCSKYTVLHCKPLQTSPHHYVMDSSATFNNVISFVTGMSGYTAMKVRY